jgi:hypothetical protein
VEKTQNIGAKVSQFPLKFSPAKPLKERNFFSGAGSNTVPDPVLNEVTSESNRYKTEDSNQDQFGFKAFDLQPTRSGNPGSSQSLPDPGPQGHSLPAGARPVEEQQLKARAEEDSADLNAFSHLEAPPSISEDKVWA